MKTLREILLRDAITVVTKDRQAAHGLPEDSFALIAQFWSSYLGIEVSSPDVALMLGLLKTARLRYNPESADSWLDLAGYAACGFEAQAKLPPEPAEEDEE